MDFFAEHFNKLILMLALAGCSAFCSGSETALFSLTPADLNRLRRSKNLPARSALLLYNRLPDFLLTVLFCNLVVNILFFTISSTFAMEFVRRYGTTAGAAFGFATLVFLLVFSEVIPKICGAAASYHFSLLAGLPMALLYRALRPVRSALRAILHYFERLANVRPEDDDAADELKLLFELGQNRGVLSRDENGLLTAVVELPEIRAGDIMTSRVDAAAIGQQATREDILQVARESGHSKLLMRGKDSDEFVGWVDAREAFFLLQPGDPAERIVRKLLALSEFDRGDQILHRFMEKRERMAVVLDERGASAGILALSDLASEIFGELGDEDVPPAEYVVSDGSNAYLIDGRLSLREWRRLFKIEEEFPGLYSLGGLMSAALGRPPVVGDSVTVAGVGLTVQTLRRSQCGIIRAEGVVAPERGAESELC